MSISTPTRWRIAARPGTPDVVLRHVSHAQRTDASDSVVLLPIDLTIDGGAVVALVGPDGSGKSTLLEIVAGHWLPTEGEVLIGGEPVVGPGRRGRVVHPAEGSDLRTQIAESLADNPDVLLLDEPFADLSEADREQLQEDLYEIWRRTGVTMVIATLDAAHLGPLATRVIELSAGPGEIVSDLHVDTTPRILRIPTSPRVA